MKHVNLQALFGAVVIMLASFVHAAAQTTFSNSSPITIPGTGTASPYPSNITAAGLNGAISRVTVTLTGFTHTFSSDFGALLVSPDGATVDLVSGCGSSAANANLTFDDAAPTDMPDFSTITSGTYRPTQCFTSTYSPPAPSSPYGTTLSGLNGGNPNGVWKLFVQDFANSGQSGSISGGWSLTIESTTNPGSLQFNSASYSGIEGNTVTVTITRANGFNGSVAVSYATSGGLATGGASCGAGVDYITPSGTITFSGNILSQNIVIQLCQDSIADPNETMNLTLSAPTNGATLGTPSTTTLTIINSPQQHILDFDGDAKTDFAIVRNTGGGPTGQLTWWMHLSGLNATYAAEWGRNSDSFVPQDYDGDNKTDIAVWRPGTATVAAFYIFQSQTSTVRIEAFGQMGDDPTVVDDYDGDGKADLAVYRSGVSSGDQSTWFYRGSLNNPAGNVTHIPWGKNGDFVSPGDYDGDGRADFVIQRNDGSSRARFWMLMATGTHSSLVYGSTTDRVVPGDYDGDGKTDIAIVRGFAGQLNWYVLRSSTGNTNNQATIFGVSATDFPAQGDYDGDGKTDIAIFRPNSMNPASNGFWVLRSTTGPQFYRFGASSDYPVANYNSH